MVHHYWEVFTELIRTPFLHLQLIWGIVPLYFGLLLNELTSSKASFKTAIQTGFSFLWASAQWLYPYFKQGAPGTLLGRSLLQVNTAVTALVLSLGALALYCGVRRKYPPYLSFLGHTRFSNYFMITIFPMQAHYLDWTWDRLAAIAIVALPAWLLLQFGLMPFRQK